MALQQFVDQVDRPEDEMDDDQEQGVVVIPAYQDGINAQKRIDDAFVPVAHAKPFSRKNYEKLLEQPI
jgi:hypothetical protein